MTESTRADEAVEVKSAGEGRGDGLFSKKTFQRGDLIFRERPLVGGGEEGMCARVMDPPVVLS